MALKIDLIGPDRRADGNAAESVGVESVGIVTGARLATVNARGVFLREASGAGLTLPAVLDDLGAHDDAAIKPVMNIARVTLERIETVGK